MFIIYKFNTNNQQIKFLLTKFLFNGITNSEQWMIKEENPP